MHRRGAKSRHPTQDTHAGKDQVLDGWFVLQGTPFAVCRYGATDKAVIGSRKPFGGNQLLALRVRGEILDQHVRPRYQVTELGCVLRLPGQLIEIERKTFLTAIPNYVSTLAERRRGWFDHANDPGPLIAQQHGGKRRSS